LPPPVAVPEGPTSPPVNPVPSPVAQALGPLAAGPMGMMFNRQVGQMPTFATYKATWFPDVAVQGQNTHLGYQQQDFSFSAPVWQDPCNEWSVSAGVRGEFFHTGAFLPDSGRPFPDELWNVRFGTSYEWHLLLSNSFREITFGLGSWFSQEAVVFRAPFAEPRFIPVGAIRHPVAGDRVE
jgi:hypothetical protein